MLIKTFLKLLFTFTKKGIRFVLSYLKIWNEADRALNV